MTILGNFQPEDELQRLKAEVAELEAEVAALEAERTGLKEVVHWAQAVLTALNVGDVLTGSLLHLKLREVLVAFRTGFPDRKLDVISSDNVTDNVTDNVSVLDELKEHLRDEHRLKFACDYCWIWKYGKLSIFSDAVWVPLLKEHVDQLSPPLSVTWTARSCGVKSVFITQDIPSEGPH